MNVEPDLSFGRMNLLTIVVLVIAVQCVVVVVAASWFGSETVAVCPMVWSIDLLEMMVHLYLMQVKRLSIMVNAVFVLTDSLTCVEKPPYAGAH